MKRINFIIIFISLFFSAQAQVFKTIGNQTIQGSLTVNNDISFNHQQVNFSANPRTTLNPMSFKIWDNYNNGGPTSYGTIMEIYGRSGHQTSQLYFGGWDNSRIRYREAFYNQNTWSDWVTLLDSKNDVESQGSLKISGNGNHFIANGSLGIGTPSPQTRLDVNGEITFGTNELYSLFTGHAAGAAIKMGTSSSTWDRNMHLGFIDNNRVFNSTLSLIHQTGYVGIGTTTPDQMLTVNGAIHAKEVLVDMDILADFVFNSDYSLMPLHKVEAFVKINKHLPEIPSAAEVKEKGLSMGEMQNKLLQKIEELMLYVIEQQKRIEQLEKSQK
jgi:hypothetical protein